MTTQPTVNGDLDRIRAPGRWHLRPEQSSAEFHVKHFWGLMTVSGRFGQWQGTLTNDEHGSRIELSLDAASVDTGNRKRDAHLRSGDFFDAERHPQVVFASTADLRSAHAGPARLHGDLTAAGITVPVELDVTVEASGDRLVIEGRVTVDRTRFGMTWSPLGMASKEAELHVRATLTRESEG